MHWEVLNLPSLHGTKISRGLARSSDLMYNNSLLTVLARAITLEAWALAGLSGHLRAACIRVSKITRALARTKELNTFGGHWKQRSDDCNFGSHALILL